ncbi:hypothetical protein BDZ94DRAFT_885655 [Collybia nuda]|uniref:F-box domain-containing protein n=1 Tax=Collybia nuda TaxID=64659 RepID=A0A9P5Y137_9AGAR|nr:hypothetical protein BDZ94DRAFT_885655 [Collybia nuda]
MAVDDREKLGILLNLSTELLLLIFESLPAPALLSVSRASRQLHYLALPVYFSRYNISNIDLERGRLALEGDTMRALPGLQTSISLTSLDHLSCKFSGGNSYFTWEVHHLCCLISKVERVRAVTLDLGNIDSRWIDGLTLINDKAWKERFICLLAGVVNKGCSHLVVTHGHFIPVDSPELLVNARKPRGSFRESVSSVTAFLKPPSSTLRKLLEAPYLNQLENISIHSSLFFINPFHEWFIQIISTSPIHTLSLRLSGIPHKTWSSTLSRINIQSLSYFSAESVDIRFVDLQKFLSRHPSIETLDLHPNFVYAGPRNLGRRAKRPHLPEFHSLSGSPENVRDLLDTLRPPLPHLRTIKLSLPTQQSVFRAVDFLKLENKISEVIQGVMPTELSLRFLVPYFVDDQSRGVKAGSSYERVFPLFPSVQILKFVSDGHFAFVKWIIPKLPQWLATFPSLRHVMFSGDCTPSDSSGRTALVQSIGFACTTVTLIVMDKEHHPVPHR